MTCGHCVMSVSEELSEIPGVKNVDVISTRAQPKVTVLTDTDDAALSDAASEAGFAIASRATCGFTLNDGAGVPSSASLFLPFPEGTYVHDIRNRHYFPPRPPQPRPPLPVVRARAPAPTPTCAVTIVSAPLGNSRCSCSMVPAWQFTGWQWVVAAAFDPGGQQGRVAVPTGGIFAAGRHGSTTMDTLVSSVSSPTLGSWWALRGRRRMLAGMRR